jgi:hypothetical protein
MCDLCIKFESLLEKYENGSISDTTEPDHLISYSELLILDKCMKKQCNDRACQQLTRSLDPTRRDLLSDSLEQCIRALFRRAVHLFRRSLAAPASDAQSPLFPTPNPAPVPAASPETDPWDGWDAGARERMLYVVDRCLDFRTINIMTMNNLFVCQPHRYSV